LFSNRNYLKKGRSSSIDFTTFDNHFIVFWHRLKQGGSYVYSMKNRFILVMLMMLGVVEGVAQKNLPQAFESSLLGITLPSRAVRDKGLFPTATAKAVLEMEASRDNIVISDVEVLNFSNSYGLKDSAVEIINRLKKVIDQNGYELFASKNDGAFVWLIKSGSQYLFYSSVSKKEADAYVGAADKVPDYVAESRKNSVNQLVPSGSGISANTQNQLPAVLDISSTAAMLDDTKIYQSLVANWGTLSGAKVNWRDESTGGMLVSDVSKGYGLDLHEDGNFLQTTVVTSGRPNYRVFTSTSGKWSVKEDKIWFYPEDRHYRKWENEIIMVDEHSVPKTYYVYWRLDNNKITYKNCLYIRYETETDYRELCIE